MKVRFKNLPAKNGAWPNAIDFIEMICTDDTPKNNMANYKHLNKSDFGIMFSIKIKRMNFSKR